jgi:hypothetical protein
VGYRAPKNDGYEGNSSATSKVMNAHDSLPLGESLGVLFIGVVSGSGNNVRTAPLTAPFILST